MPRLAAVIEHARQARELTPLFEERWKADSERTEELLRAWKTKGTVDRAVPFEGRRITANDVSDEYDKLQEKLTADVQSAGGPDTEEGILLQQAFVVKLLDLNYIHWESTKIGRYKAWLTYDELYEEAMKLQGEMATLNAGETEDEEAWIAAAETVFATLKDNINQMRLMMELLDNRHHNFGSVLKRNEQLFRMAERLLLS